MQGLPCRGLAATIKGCNITLFNFSSFTDYIDLYRNFDLSKINHYVNF
jgi:hypothetical protein